SIKISMRARPGYNVSSLALHMGGGGHELAAGFTMHGPLETVVKQVLPRLLAEAAH
ncbi:MAG: bifunctional oligoribonuclease/PAP phosphatase NrnA, partial [Anaerolineales bacterium]